jgi:hypothetical protein
MPRLRSGQLSIASVVPAVHSAPMPKPKRMRRPITQAKLGAKAIAASKSASQSIEAISTPRRPHLSAAHPAAAPPPRRTRSVRVTTPAVCVVVAPNSSAIIGITRR